MSENFAIGIPSYRRAERLMRTEGASTLAYLHPSLRDRTFLHVRSGEREAYRPVAERFGVGLVELPDDVDRVRGTRDAMLRWAIDRELRQFLMIDDDLRLDYKPDARTYVRMVGGFHFDDMVAALRMHCVPSVPVVGVVARQFSQDRAEEWRDDTRIIQVYCFDVDVLARERMTFGQFGIELMTDYAFVLEMLGRGYHNRCLQRFCRDDDMQAPGGCETFRTTHLASVSALQLARLFPGIVVPYAKVSGTWGEPHVGVRVAWSRAFGAGSCLGRVR